MNPTRTNAGKSEATKSTSAQSEPLKTQSARPAAKPQPAKAPAFRTEPTAPAAAKIETSRPEPAKPQPKSAAGKPAPTQPVPTQQAPTAAPAKTTIPVRSEAPKAQPAPAQAQKPEEQNRISLEITRPGAHQVCVAGTFNEWKPEKTPLVQMGHGRWVGNLNVKPGRYEYLFVVDGQWVQDPNARESVQNPYGGQNSVLVVSA